MAISIKVDVVGQVKLFRSATFQTKYPFIEEAIQNSQRAKATEIDFWFKPDKLIVTDDGIGLKDPEDLFTIAHSGWDDETKLEQKPFGIGFFSCVKMANLITVESNKFRIFMDVQRVIRDGITELEVEELEEPVKGFRAILTDFVEPLEEYSLFHHISRVAAYIQTPIVRYNNREIKRYGFDQTDGSKFATLVKTKKIEGWLRPYNFMEDFGLLFEYPPQVKIFYQDRLVKGLNLAPHLAGIIAIRDNNLVDLRSPDRKDFIENEKFQEFKNMTLKLAKPMLYRIISDGTDEDLNKYEELIKSQLSVQDYKDYLTYVIINDETTLRDILDKDPADRTIKDVDEIIVKLSPMESAKVELIQDPQNPENLEFTYTKIDDQREDTIKRRVLRKGDKLPDQTEIPIFYLEKEELLQYIDIVSEALKHKVRIIIVRNGLELEALRLREDILHISELKRTTETRARVNNVGPLDLVERRALWLFNIISRIVGLDRNPFIIGDVELEETTKFGSIQVHREIIQPRGAADQERIMINRESLRLEALRASTIDRILPSDLVFLGSNINVITHELAHFLYDTDDETLTHYKIQIDLIEKIMSVMFRH